MDSCITVITLCRNNPQDLAETLTALPSGVEGLHSAWELLVLDGSDGPECSQVARRCANDLRLPLHYEWRRAGGIYTAMNEALQLSKGELVSFINAGDRYTHGALMSLVDHWEALGRPAAVFGQAWVQPIKEAGRGVKPWLTPPPSVRLQRWLCRMVPCHQAFVFEGNFARSHLYDAESLIADRQIMREAIRQAGLSCYLSRPVCVFSLGGTSNQLPTRSELMRRLREPGRTRVERIVEPIKWALRAFGLASHQPRLMRVHAVLWGWLCRLPGPQ
jgi:glycosyltransferase involved in cell wall biosynthesis